MLENLSSHVLHKAAQLKAKIEDLSNDLRQLLEGASGLSVSIHLAKTSGKRMMSAAGRARIAAAQKTRWAKANKGKVNGGPSARSKRKMSPAARAKIAAAAKARWAKAKAAGKKSL